MVVVVLGVMMGDGRGGGCRQLSGEEGSRVGKTCHNGVTHSHLPYLLAHAWILLALFFVDSARGVSDR